MVSTAASTLVTLERTGPRRLTDLAVNEEVTQPSMTALVTQLEELGLAERRRNPADAELSWSRSRGPGGNTSA